MGQFDPGEALIAKVKKISFVHKGANKKKVFLLKAETDAETEARIRAHTEDESMELTDKQIETIAGKVVELAKAEPPKPVENKNEPKKPDVEAATVAPSVDGAEKLGGALKALRDAMPKQPSDEDSEKTEEELYAEIQAAIDKLESLHAGLNKCHAAKSKKTEVLSPATQEQQTTNSAKEPAGAAEAQARVKDAAFDLSDEELEAYKKSITDKCEKELDEKTE
jgi:hypothetical protein